MAHTDPAVAVLSSPVRRRILDVLESAALLEPASGTTDSRDAPEGLNAPGTTAAQLAEELSLHVTTVRFHLDQLVAAGLVRADFRRHVGAGRPRKVYARVAVPAAPVSSSESLLLLSTLLTEAFTAQAQDQRPLSPDEAGRRWALEHVVAEEGAAAATAGQWIVKLGHAVDVLRSWGYEPELSTGPGGRDARIELSSCPFRELARQNTAVVCGIHRGLIAGTMSRLGEPDTAVELQPFADGDRCVARLRRLERPDPSPGRDSPAPTAEPA